MKFKEYHIQRKKALKKNYNPLIIKDRRFTKQNVAVMSFSEGFYEGFKFAGGKLEEAKPEDYD